MRRFGIILVFSLVITGMGIPQTHAQSALPFGNATIALQPNFPESGQTVTARLEAYTYDTTNASIAWFIDGIEKTAFQNEREISFVTGEEGVAQTITVRVTLRDGNAFTIERVVTPTRLDVIIEADTHTPPSYRGRALPSVGSTMRAVASMQSVPGSERNALSYSWKLNNKQLYGGPVLGKNTASFVTPMGQTVSVNVTVFNDRGERIAQKTVIVRSTDPEIYFYENNPLRGTSDIVLADPHPLIADELIVRAEPYYMNKNIFAQNPLVEWSVGRQQVENPSTDPQNITLRKTGSQGRFDIGFHIRNMTQLLQGAENSFTVTF